MNEFSTRPGMKVFHRFRGHILGLTVFRERLYAATTKGLYRMDKNEKRWRKMPFDASFIKP